MSHAGAEPRSSEESIVRVAAGQDGTGVPLDLRERWAGDFDPLGAALPVGVITAVGMGTVVYLNETAVALLGRPEPELIGHGWESVIHPDDRPELVACIAMLLDTGMRQRLVVRTADEGGRSLELTIGVLGRREEPTGWLATVDDVSERVSTERRLAYEATHDHLTHLPNRALLADRIALAGRRLERARRSAVLAVLFIDLDGFKEVNDRYGHAAGDHVLRTTAARLAHTVRAGDTVARLGGDEFVAACELGSEDEVDALLARVGAAISVPIHLREGTITPRASIGVALASELEDADALLDRADREMYRHKAGRRQAGPAGDR